MQLVFGFRCSFALQSGLESQERAILAFPVRKGVAEKYGEDTPY
jgi:hypothetical protein